MVERVLGADFPGTVVADDGRGYNVLRAYPATDLELQWSLRGLS